MPLVRRITASGPKNCSDWCINRLILDIAFPLVIPKKQGKLDIWERYFADSRKIQIVYFSRDKKIRAYSANRNL